MRTHGRLTLILTLAGILSLAFLNDTLAVDVFREAFDTRQEGVTIDGVDSWQVAVGSPNNAVLTSNATFSGEGKSLKLSGVSVPVRVARGATYGALEPAWVEMVVRPGMGSEAAAVPTGGIGAVCFDHSGRILVADGNRWVEAGMGFDSSTWYRVLLKVDLANHLYSVYISPASASKIPFVPDKENLNFINPSINSISSIGFSGAYSTSQAGDTYVDEITVHFVQRLQIVTAPQNLVKGFPSNAITVQLQNSNSEPQTAWEDFTLELRSSSDGGQFSRNKEPWDPITHIVIPEGAQQANFYYKDTSTGKPVISVQETPDRGWQKAAQELNLVAEGQSFEISVNSPQIAGKPFSVLITAKDAEGNSDTFYNGTVDLAAKFIEPATGTKTLLPQSISGFEEGVVEVPASYADCGIVQITVQDRNDPSKKGSSGQVLFVPSQLAVTAGSAQQLVAQEFPLVISAVDENSRPTPNYKGPVALTAVGISPANISGGVISPGQTGPDIFEHGVAQANIRYDRWGIIRIAAQDLAKPTQAGSSENVAFGPAGLALTIKKPSGDRDFYYTGESIEATIIVHDVLTHPIRNFEGNVLLSSTPDFELPSSLLAFGPANAGEKEVLFSVGTAGTYVLKAESAEYPLSAESPAFKVKQATIEVISAAAPVGTTEVLIQLVDEQGRRVTSENQLMIHLTFVEDDPNNSLFFSSPGKPILFRNGLAKVVIGNTQAETVTVSPQADGGFKIKAGTVTFGRVGASGIGTLMLVEDKESPNEKK